MLSPESIWEIYRHRLYIIAEAIRKAADFFPKKHPKVNEILEKYIYVDDII